MKKIRVLVMVDWYAPGFKAGGPIRSAVNFADQLENELDIFILTTDRDLGDNQAYTNIETDKWTHVGNHQVFYASPGFLKWGRIQTIIGEIKTDYVYLNSMFSLYFSIYPLLMNRMGKLNSRIILAPRGMLKASAMQHKSGKKKLFIRLFKTLGIPDRVTFHATDDTEEKDIHGQFGNKVRAFKAGNLPGKQPEYLPPIDKKPGELKMIFVGRIHPIKNLGFLLNALRGIREKVDLTIIATLENETYWNKCKDIIQSLPENISTTLLQDLPHEKITPHIQQHHIFALPTKGENFGHSIFEALAAGRPVLISDQTPWRNLEIKKAGWDIQMEDAKYYSAIISRAAGMDLPEISQWCKGAWDHAYAYLHESGIKQSYLNQFS